MTLHRSQRQGGKLAARVHTCRKMSSSAFLPERDGMNCDVRSIGMGSCGKSGARWRRHGLLRRVCDACRPTLLAREFSQWILLGSRMPRGGMAFCGEHGCGLRCRCLASCRAGVCVRNVSVNLERSSLDTHPCEGHGTTAVAKQSQAIADVPSHVVGALRQTWHETSIDLT